MIFLFTDFGSADIYLGQVKAVLAERAPGVPVIDLLNDVPSFDIRAGAHLLAALATGMRAGDVAISVVDPGVGGARDAVGIRAGGAWFVAPDNGLASVVAARRAAPEYYTIGWRPDVLSASFHGRDLFAPVAAMLARGDLAGPGLSRKPRLATDLGGEDLAEIIYIDHFGNAMTGLRATGIVPDTRLMVGDCEVTHARVFSAVRPGELFWYANSIGLVEIAGDMTSAAGRIGLRIGQCVEVGGRSALR
jgi:S-adenosylmethionine hydrolase